MANKDLLARCLMMGRSVVVVEIILIVGIVVLGVIFG